MVCTLLNLQIAIVRFGITEMIFVVWFYHFFIFFKRFGWRISQQIWKLAMEYNTGNVQNRCHAICCSPNWFLFYKYYYFFYVFLRIFSRFSKIYINIYLHRWIVICLWTKKIGAAVTSDKNLCMYDQIFYLFKVRIVACVKIVFDMLYVNNFYLYREEVTSLNIEWRINSNWL